MRFLKPIFTVVLLGVVIFAIYQWVVLPLFPKTVRVAHLIDGDTLIVMENGKPKIVQLIGADAPERTGTNKDHQCFDAQAKKIAADYVNTNRDVRLAADDKLGDKDIYGRSLRYVTFKNGTMLNEALIRDGAARQTDPLNRGYSRKEAFTQLEQTAQQNKAGLWADDTCAGKP